MANTEIFLRNIFGTTRPNIRPLVLALNITNDLLFEQHISMSDIKATKHIYPDVARLLHKKPETVYKSVIRLAHRCWDALVRRDLSRVLSAKCNRFAYTYNRQGFLCKFSLLTLLMIATEPIPVPEELRQVQAHQGGLDEVVSGEIRCGYRPPPAGADAGQALGQGYGAVRDFPFPAASGKMKSVLRAAPRWDKVSQSRGHDRPTQLLDTLSSQRIENG